MIDGLDPVIHAPKRLVAMAILANASAATFASLRERLQVSESDLSKQMGALQRAGYVSVSKLGRGRGGVTRYSITAAGSAAFRSHRAALRALIAEVDVGEGEILAHDDSVQAG